MDAPLLGAAIPQQGNSLTKAIGSLLLTGYQWHIEGEVLNASKFVMILAPHTSSWEFLTNIATRLTLGLGNHWLIADAYAWWPLGSFMGWLGGIPVDRSAHHDLVPKMVQRFRKNDRFILALYPEGTRRRVQQWKTGFWHIAVGADVPIQIVSIDYEKRATIFGPAFEPSGNVEADMKKIQAHYQRIRAKYPDQFDGEYI